LILLGHEKKHAETLKAIFHQPVLSSVKWQDVEALFASLGAEIEEGRGSRVRILLNNQVSVFHRPHPRKEAGKGALVSVRKFLIACGVMP
jgi:HicA toxin of bacterial toxin-antitoxin,